MIRKIQDWINELKWRSQLYLINLGYLIVVAVSYLLHVGGFQTAVFWDKVLHFCANAIFYNLVVYIAISVLLDRADEDRYLKELGRKLVLAYPLTNKKIFLKELQEIISEETKQAEAESRETDERIRELMAQIKR